jgi:hypothetical protein
MIFFEQKQAFKNLYVLTLTLTLSQIGRGGKGIPLLITLGSD